MRIELKRFICFFLYTIFIIIVSFYALKYQYYLRQEGTFKFDASHVFLFMTIYPIVLGLIIALPYIACKVKEEGVWKFDWIKFLAIGTPTLYIALSPITYIIIQWWPYITYIYPYNIKYYPHTLSGVAFGFLILTSLYKQNEEKE